MVQRTYSNLVVPLRKRIVWLFIAAVIIGFFRLFTPEEFVFSGHTMGTTYSIKAYGSRLISNDQIETEIQIVLDEFTQTFSTYEPDSLISKVNRLSIGEPISVSKLFFELFNLSQSIWNYSDGAWDPTIFPLVELWGFMSNEKIHTISSDLEIDLRLDKVGFDKISLDSNGQLVKKALVQLDFSSIAKGFCVDKIALLLHEKGMTSYIVEIGGEVKVSTARPNGSPWRVGISRPESDSRYEDTVTVIEVSNKAVATSGDYRNFFELDGSRYSHILDPRSGRPVLSDLKSITIVGSSCAVADALATTSFVLGKSKTMQLISNYYPNYNVISY